MVFCFVSFIKAQSNGDIKGIKNYGQFHFIYANDVFNRTDRYLTQYTQFNYVTPFRSWKKDLMIQHEFRLQQNVYTPSDIFGDTIQRNDRPYSSILFAALHNNVFNPDKKILFRSQIALGIIGRHGFGEDMQKEFHYAVDSRQALGWQYQVRDAAYIQLQGGIEKAVLTSKGLDYIPYAQIDAGTVFNDIGIGHVIRLHLRDHYFSQLNNSPLKTLRLFAEMKNEVKLVGYNGTLQGAIGSRHNPYVLKQSAVSPVVTLTQLSLGFAYQRFGITFSQSFLSREFNTGLKHRWGHIQFLYLL
jgi:lipid A 3-O-deacylase